MSMPGETYVCWVESPVLPLLPALAARGIPSTSTAAIIVTRPRPPLPQSAFERESSLLPVPHSALERVWPAGLPFLSIAILPLTRRSGSAFAAESATLLSAAQIEPGATYLALGGTTSPAWVRGGAVPPSGLSRLQRYRSGGQPLLLCNQYTADLHLYTALDNKHLLARCAP